MTMANLTTYLNDHLAASVGAIELLDHLIASAETEELTTFLKALRAEIAADQAVLKSLLQKAGGSESAVRKAGAWMLEKLSRAKLSGEEEGLGLMQALEGLSLGILGKRALWRTLSAAAEAIPAAQEFDFPQLEKRAEEQFAQVQARILRDASLVLGR